MFKQVYVWVLLLVTLFGSSEASAIQSSAGELYVDSLRKVIERTENRGKLAVTYARLAFEYSKSDDTLFRQACSRAVFYAKDAAPAEKGDAYFYLAKLFAEEKQSPQKALPFAQLSLAASLAAKDTTRAILANHLLGAVYFKVSDYKNTLDVLYGALKLSQGEHRRSKAASAMSHIGAVYANLGMDDESISMQKKALPLMDSVADRMIYIETLANIGTGYHNKSDFKTAVMWLERSEKMAREGKFFHQFYYIKSTLSEICFGLYEETGDKKYLERSLSEAREGLNLAEQENNHYGMRICHNTLSFILYTTRQYTEALYHAKKALSIALIEGAVIEQKRIYEVLGDIYYKMGNHEQAYESVKKDLALTQTIFNDQMKKKITEDAVKYEYEKKMDREKAVYEKRESDAKILLAQSEKHIIRRNMAIIITFVSCALLLLSIAYNHQRKLKNSQQEFTQRLIALQEEERKSISKELHDGIGQNLLVIGQQLDDHKGLISTTLEELRHIARNLHPVLLEKLGFKKAVENVIRESEAACGIFFSYDIEEVDDLLLEEQQINLYRIIQECVSNIIKHSKAADARITITRNEKYITLLIEDNGVGFDQAEAMKRKSMGLVSLKERVGLLNGSLDIVSSKSGTRIEIRVKHG